MKTKLEMQKLRDTLQQEVDTLPDKSLFGDDNTETKAENRRWIAALDSLIDGTYDPLTIDQEVWDWNTGINWSPLNDYE